MNCAKMRSFTLTKREKKSKIYTVYLSPFGTPKNGTPGKESRKMVRSMTAYGRCRAEYSGREITVEVKSVNNRYLDTAIRLPRTWGYMEERVKAEISACGITRGKVDVYISVDQIGSTGTEVRLDEGFADSYMKALDELRDRFSLTDDRTLMAVAQNRDLFCTKAPEEDEEQDWKDVKEVLDGAIRAHIEAREREGERLARDISEKKEKIAACVPEIEALSASSREKYRARLEEKLNAVLSEKGITADEGRILTEVTLFADKIAVDEETVRLRSHLASFDELLTREEPVGRQFDFLLQEMNREVNTIGSKANELLITQRVLAMKNDLEKIREQIQNIE